MLRAQSRVLQPQFERNNEKVLPGAVTVIAPDPGSGAPHL